MHLRDQDGLELYKLPLEESHRDDQFKLRRCVFGKHLLIFLLIYDDYTEIRRYSCSIAIHFYGRLRTVNALYNLSFRGHAHDKMLARTNFDLSVECLSVQGCGRVGVRTFGVDL